MNSSEVKLPTNRKFGFFFTFVFAVAAVYFYKSNNDLWTNTFGALSFIFLFCATFKADILLPLNKLWMRFGLLLSIIVSPIVLGIIFFGIFMPIAFLIRLSGRDELRLKFSKKPSYWITRSKQIKSESFKQQF